MVSASGGDTRVKNYRTGTCQSFVISRGGGEGARKGICLRIRLVMEGSKAHKS